MSSQKKEGKTAIEAGLKELQEAGYIKKVRVTNQSGQVIRWETTIFDTPNQ